MIHAFSVQKALDAALLPVLAAMSPPVDLVDHAAQDQPYPFVQFGRIMTQPDHELARKVTRVTVPLTVFSQFRGQEQVAAILAAIETALDQQMLTLETGEAVRCDMERADTARDADGVTYIGSAIFTVIVTH